ncbi:ferritin-like domain-containing protein [Brevundimonas sp.]|uniref:ferritin-like domain-containing protein n=1 Tax=Brevundimonas sp. TaxID=1871086 RepID=UPI00391A6980
MTKTTDDVLRAVFITGLKNAHAVEHQALALMDRQLDRLKHYEDVEARLREHRGETETQIERLEAILGQFDEDPSGLKDAAMSLSGNLAALGHAFADDEILKNAFANFAFENFEVASYKSLIVLARNGGFSSALDPLAETLGEEEAMAAWVDDNLTSLTEKYVALKAAGENASR